MVDRLRFLWLSTERDQPEDGGNPMKILVIDDDDLLRAMICSSLKEKGFTVLEARDGVDGINKLCTISDINAVITDIQMPRANGIDVLQYIWRLGLVPPTYVHSSEPTFWFNNQCLDLAPHIKDTFGTFATFRLKGRNTLKDIAAFTESLTT